MTEFRAAVVQMRSGTDIDRNISDAEKLIRAAAADGAQYVQTPEMTNIVELKSAGLFDAIEAEQGNDGLARLCALAQELKIWLHVGSMSIRLETARAANRAYLIAPTGTIVTRYDKIHMFDVDLEGGESYRESKVYRPGDQAVVADLPWGRLGLSICYDVRFPHLYRTLAQAGAQILAIPAAFTRKTGQAHWHILQRARAIETGCFVVAAAQGGDHEDGRSTFGHSLIIDPWGEVLAELAHDEPGYAVATIDTARVAETRQRVPSLQNGRPFEVSPDASEHTLKAVS
ncbi:MAG: carbon-nitrogen hydrolase family protein [Pseudomonadota bacterium]